MTNDRLIVVDDVWRWMIDDDLDDTTMMRNNTTIILIMTITLIMIMLIHHNDIVMMTELEGLLMRDMHFKVISMLTKILTIDISWSVSSSSALWFRSEFCKTWDVSTCLFRTWPYVSDGHNRLLLSSIYNLLQGLERGTSATIPMDLGKIQNKKTEPFLVCKWYKWFVNILNKSRKDRQRSHSNWPIRVVIPY